MNMVTKIRSEIRIVVCALAFLGAMADSRGEKLTLLCDGSGSLLASDRANLRGPAAGLFISLLAMHDEGLNLEIFSFTETVKEMIPLTTLSINNVDQVCAQLKMGAEGGTSLSAAIAKVLSEKVPPRDVVVLSDSEYDPNEVQRLLEQTKALCARGIKVSAIGLAAGRQPSLADLAAATGGQYFYLDTRNEQKPSDWELIVLKLFLAVRSPDLFLINGSKGLPLTRYAKKGLFIAAKDASIVAPDGTVICREGIVENANCKLIPNSAWTLLSVRLDNQKSVEGFWQVLDKSGQQIAAAFVGQSAARIAMRKAPSANPAADDIVQAAFDVSGEPGPQLLPAEALGRCTVDALVRGESNSISRTITYPVKLGAQPCRVNATVPLWPVIPGSAELELALRHPDLPGVLAWMRAPLTVKPARYVYEYAGQSASGSGVASSGWRALGPGAKIEMHQGERVSVRIKSAAGSNDCNGTGTLRVLDGTNAVQETALTANGDSYVANLDAKKLATGNYDLQINVGKIESVKGRIPLLDYAVGANISRMESCATLGLQVTDAPPPPLVAGAIIELRADVRQGVQLRGCYRIRVEGGDAASRALARSEICQRTLQVRLSYKTEQSDRDIEVKVEPFQRTGADGDAEIFEARISSYGVYYIGEYQIRACALFLSSVGATLSEKSVTFNATAGLVQCVVLRENRLGVKKGMIDSFQSLQDLGVAYKGESTIVEIRRGAQCEKGIFVALQRGLELYCIEDGISERVPIKLQGDRYVSEKRRLSGKGKFVFRAVLHLGEEEFVLSGEALVLDPKVVLTVEPPERYPGILPEGCTFPFTARVSCNAADPDDIAAILSGHVLSCELADPQGTVFSKQSHVVTAKECEWRPSVSLNRLGQHTINVALHTEDGNRLDLVSLPVVVEPSPVAFVSAAGKSLTEAGAATAQSSPGLVQKFFMRPAPVTVKMNSVLSSRCWRAYSPAVMRIKSGNRVYEKKFEAEETEWVIHPDGTSRWIAEVLLVPVYRRDFPLQDLRLEYDLWPTLQYRIVAWRCWLAGLIALAGMAGLVVVFLMRAGKRDEEKGKHLMETAVAQDQAGEPLLLGSGSSSADTLRRARRRMGTLHVEQ